MRLAFLTLLIALAPALSACSPSRLALQAATATVPPAATLAPGAEAIVPLTVVQGPNGSVLALVPVSIKGQGPFAFALDTGASQSIVDAQLASQLKLPVVGSAGPVTGVTGTEQANLVAVDQWQAGNVALPQAQAISLSLPGPSTGVGLAGLLGSDILSQFGAITVDYQNQRLVLHAPD